MSKLTDKQAMFCKEYLIDLNATQAAIRAGYSEKSAREQGYENMTKPHILEEIQKLMDERSKRVEMDADYVLDRYKKIIDDDIKNYLSFESKEIFFEDEEGEKDSYHKMDVNLKKSDDVDTWNISEISIGKDGQFKFKLHCKDNAMRDVGKHLKLFTDKQEIVSNNVNHNINEEVLTSEERKARIKELNDKNNK